MDGRISISISDQQVVEGHVKVRHSPANPIPELIEEDDEEKSAIIQAWLDLWGSLTLLQSIIHRPRGIHHHPSQRSVSRPPHSTAGYGILWGPTHDDGSSTSVDDIIKVGRHGV